MIVKKIQLTEEQMVACGELFVVAQMAESVGRPGIVAAQIRSNGEASVTFLPNEVAKAVVDAKDRSSDEPSGVGREGLIFDWHAGKVDDDRIDDRSIRHPHEFKEDA